MLRNLYLLTFHSSDMGAQIHNYPGIQIGIKCEDTSHFNTLSPIQTNPCEAVSPDPVAPHKIEHFYCPVSSIMFVQRNSDVTSKLKIQNNKPSSI